MRIQLYFNLKIEMERKKDEINQDSRLEFQESD